MGITIEVMFTEEHIKALADEIEKRGVLNKESKPQTFYSIQDVAKRLDKCDQTIRNYIKNDLIPATRVGREFIITETDLNNFINGISK